MALYARMRKAVPVKFNLQQDPLVLERTKDDASHRFLRPANVAATPVRRTHGLEEHKLVLRTSVVMRRLCMLLQISALTQNFMLFTVYMALVCEAASPAYRTDA